MLRGAIERTLGPRRFRSAEIQGSAGTIRFSSEEPATSEEVSKIEIAANGKVAEDAEFLEFEMEREEAEGHFGRGIYDLGGERGDDALLRIVRIPEWDVSCCWEAHVSSTGQIGTIRIDGTSFDEGSKELAVRFHIE